MLWGEPTHYDPFSLTVTRFLSRSNSLSPYLFSVRLIVFSCDYLTTLMVRNVKLKREPSTFARFGTECCQCR